MLASADTMRRWWLDQLASAVSPLVGSPSTQRPGRLVDVQ